MVKRLFWPVLTIVFAAVVFFFWFFMRPIEKEVTANVAAITVAYPWANFDVTDDDVILYGIAPDQAARDELIAKVKAATKIDEVKSEITLVPVEKVFRFSIEINDDAITLRGQIPPEMDRFALIEKVEKAKPGFVVYDDLDTANGADSHFGQWVDYIIGLSADFDEGQILLSNNRIRVDKDKRKRNSFQEALPAGLKEEGARAL